MGLDGCGVCGSSFSFKNFKEEEFSKFYNVCELDVTFYLSRDILKAVKIPFCKNISMDQVTEFTPWSFPGVK